MTAEEVIKQCMVEGNNVKLPNIQLDRKTYMEVAKKLNTAGGKWKGGKIAAFVFEEDPGKLLGILKNGGKVNLKQSFQFFPTPAKIADRLVELAEIRGSHSILEPSAGDGAIIKAIQRAIPSKEVFCCELMPLNVAKLNQLDDALVIGEDFLKLSNHSFDRIIMNPPFSRGQDTEHILCAFECLEFGGRMVAVCSKHWVNSTNKKETAFREWLSLQNHEIIEVPAKTFAESGTNIETLILVINK